jgi:hypothetical protein
MTRDPQLEADYAADQAYVRKCLAARSMLSDLIAERRFPTNPTNQTRVAVFDTMAGLADEVARVVRVWD